MARKSHVSILDTIVQHVLTAPLGEVQQLLSTAAAIVKARLAGGLQQPELVPAAPPATRVRKPRAPRQAALPAAPAAPATAAAPAATATTRRTRGPNKPKPGAARPPVPDAAPPASEAAPVTPGNPLPDAGDEPMGEE